MSGGSLNHFKAMRERRQERLDANGKKFTRGKEKFTTTSANFNFPKLEKTTQRALQEAIKKRLIKEERNKNIKVFAIMATVIISLFMAFLFATKT